MEAQWDGFLAGCDPATVSSHPGVLIVQCMYFCHNTACRKQIFIEHLLYSSQCFDKEDTTVDKTDKHSIKVLMCYLFFFITPENNGLVALFGWLACLLPMSRFLDDCITLCLSESGCFGFIQLFIFQCLLGVSA